MRDRVPRICWDGLRPLLESLSVRKLRGLGTVCGESTFAVGTGVATGPWRWRAKLAVLAPGDFCPDGVRSCGSRIGRFFRPVGGLRTRLYGRFGRATQALDELGDQSLCHAACFLGGARDRGTSRRLNVSMMRIGPPQSGQGSRNVSGMTSAVGASSRSGPSTPSNVRIFAMLALCCAEASK